jgi:hypothetical protein
VSALHRGTDGLHALGLWVLAPASSGLRQQCAQRVVCVLPTGDCYRCVGDWALLESCVRILEGMNRGLATGVAHPT